jgi:hypothetical protein
MKINANPKPRKKVKKKTDRRRLVDSIDQYDSDYCLVSNNFACILCGGLANSCHHYFHKANHGNVRFNRSNHCPACFGCHIIKIHTAGESEELRDKVIEKIGWDAFEALKAKAYLPSEDSIPDLRDLLEVKKYDIVDLCDKFPERIAMMSNAALGRLELARRFVESNKDKSRI